ncbi:MATE family efflux transporter [Schaedlerella arabinosiphila]|uniref:Multidrug export protein MepA n=1 Tax=Schaedlerella arabinosiphila TaxID=2044587 RepID=A0A426DGY9_9FIRM|nr:MATE family efflux transporter [Schaedlerella arabinosiphila]RRK31998.1 MATE family efflux transporter [Schaedlerella arabinosiphila]
MVKNDERLGNAPLGRLMVSMALPAVAAQVINVLYNIVDRIYIGHIPGYGELALTGVGVTAPILMVISAFSAFAGMGGAPQASIQLGKKNYEGAEKILGTSVAMLLLFSVVLTAVFQAFKTPILYAFGASDNTIVHAREYITIYLAGTVFVQFALGLNTYISGQGNAKIAMLSVLLGAVTNIILDPVLIFGFHMGVRGAALATVISQALSAAWVLRFLTGSNSVIRIRRKQIRLDKKTVLGIGALGISPFIMQSTESLVMITLNTGLQKYGGDMYVGTMSIMASVMQLITIPVQGVAQGVQPIMSYNYGAGNLKRVKDTFLRMVLVCLAGTMVFAGIAVLRPEFYARLFSSNEELTMLTCRYMPVYFLGITIFGIQMGCQTTFLALGQAKVSLVIALLRKIVLLVPLAVLLPRFMGVDGVYRAEPVADFTSVAVTMLLFFFTARKILSGEQPQ